MAERRDDLFEQANPLLFEGIEHDEGAGPRAELTAPAVTIAFMLAGNAHVTFQSRRTDTRFTYRVRLAPPPSKGFEASKSRPHFVAVLTGPDNYEYLGCIYDRKSYAHGRKSRIARNAPSAVAFEWVWRKLNEGKMHPELGVWHEGRCGRCGRRLTTVESIRSGIGPVCASRSRS